MFVSVTKRGFHLPSPQESCPSFPPTGRALTDGKRDPLHKIMQTHPPFVTSHIGEGGGVCERSERYFLEFVNVWGISCSSYHLDLITFGWLTQLYDVLYFDTQDAFSDG